MTADKWGCPDWKDGSAYPENLEVWEWKWQFLRRHASYRKLWSILKEQGDDERRLQLAQKAFGSLRDAHISLTPEGIIDPRIPQLESDPFFKREWANYVEASTWEALEHELKLWEERGDSAPQEHIERIVAAAKTLLEELKTLNLAFNQNSMYLNYRFYRNRQIGPQLQLAKEFLEYHQEPLLKLYERISNNSDTDRDTKFLAFRALKPKQLKSGRTGNWSRHLRIIDAVHQQAKPSEIWEVIRREDIEAQPDCPRVGSDEYEDLLDREVFSRQRQKGLHKAVAEWIDAAFMTSEKVIFQS